jgi:hypothetical protein
MGHRSQAPPSAVCYHHLDQKHIIGIPGTERMVTWIFGKTVPKEDHISSNTGCENKTSTGEWGVRFYGDTIGHDGIREAVVLLAGHLPKAAIPTARRMVEGEFACLEWRGDAAHAVVRDGVDSFVIRDGFIVGMTAYYSVESTLRRSRSCTFPKESICAYRFERSEGIQ